MKWCKRCLTPDTRPRVEFTDGVCNACLWHDKKQTEINWGQRQVKLREICNLFRRQHKFDVIIPCSGGKDGSYVAWRMKHEFGMHPLCVTLAPQMPTPIGRRNLQNFIQSGFDHILLSPDPQVYRKFARQSFIDRGFPKQPFVAGISTALFNVALKFGVPFLMYGEQGEVEYGGVSETGLLQEMTRDFLVKYYYENEDPTQWGYWWRLPEFEGKLHSTWWSLFEDWDNDLHARVAKEKCGMEMLVGGSIGTFTNHSQLDDMLQDLHVYLQFVKFGFGRATSDASIEVRRGRMTREQGVQVVRKLDGTFPLEYLPAYLSYFGMSESYFWSVINLHINKDLLRLNTINQNIKGIISSRVNYTRPWILKQEVQ